MTKAAADFFRSITTRRNIFQYQGLWLVTPDAAAGGQWRSVMEISLVRRRPRARGPPGGDKEVRHARGTPRLPQGIASLPRGRGPAGRQRQPGCVGQATRRSRPVATVQPGEVIYQIRLGSAEPHGSRVVGTGAAGCPCRESVDHCRVCRRRFYPVLDQVYEIFHSPNDVTTVELVGRVASERDGIAYLVYGGHIEGLHKSVLGEANPGRGVSAG